MRFSSLIFLACFSASACGGNVVVDHGSAAGTGGSGFGGNGNGTGVVVGAGAAPGTGGAGPTTTVGPTSSSTGTGGAPPACLTLGYVGVGAKCPDEGQTCTMPGTCCGVPLVCKNGVWAMTGLTCQQPCNSCGDGLGCSPNALCVQDQIHDVETAYRCAEDPCPNGTTPDCNCAASVCSQVNLLCIGPAGNGAFICSDGTA